VLECHPISGANSSFKLVASSIESTSGLRAALGNHLKKIKSFDYLDRERELTDRIRNQLVRRFGENCARCFQQKEVEAAHIVPLEIGARTTEDNLILLCTDCHHKYDDEGRFSISSMFRLREQWIQGRNREILTPAQCHSSGQSAITPPPARLQAISNEVHQFKLGRKFRKASSLIRKCLKDHNLTSTERTFLTIKLAELTRRRAASGTLSDARKLLYEIDPSSVPQEYESLKSPSFSRCFARKFLLILRILASFASTPVRGRSSLYVYYIPRP